jgi:hypothetical protein
MDDYFLKTEPTCSNIYLIDEKLCLGNSYEIINTNVSGLSSCLDNLQNYANLLYPIFTLFTQGSANWIDASTNVLNNSAQWLNATLCVSSNSVKGWLKPINLHYNNTIKINNWYTDTPYYVDFEILNWLNLNFPTKNFQNNQVLVVDIDLYEDTTFNFMFSASYLENCFAKPKSFPENICDFCEPPLRQCNRYLNDPQFGSTKPYCFNPFLAKREFFKYDESLRENFYGTGECLPLVTRLRVPLNLSCKSTGKATLTLSNNTISYDRSIVRTITQKYQKTEPNPSWISI